MEKKEYYTFAEIAMALRKHYRRAFDLLNQMKDCFTIDSSIYKDKVDENDKFNVDFALLFKGNSEDVARFFLTIVRESSDPLVKTRKFMAQNHILKYLPPLTEEKIHFLDHANYIGVLNENIDFFLNLGGRGCNHHFIEKLLVNNESKDKYAELFHQLYEMDLLNAINEFIYINRFQTLKINGSGVKLEFGYNYFNIGYNAEKDNISFKTKDNSYDKFNYMEWNYMVEDILNTRIPRYEIPDRYLKILENTDLDLNKVKIVGPIGKSGILTIKGDEKELVLTKLLNLDGIKK